MGAPKQKWTAEEAAALKAGVLKHGAGKWKKILKDPEYGSVLHLRSNVDIKDKWRNLSMMAGLARKRTQQDGSMISLDNLIMDAINDLKDPGGSKKTTIRTYIEELYSAPPDFKRVLSETLKYLTKTRKLIKIKRRYRIAPASLASSGRIDPSMLLVEGRHRGGPRFDRDDLRIPTKFEIDEELAKMRNMTPQEVAAAAAAAVAEAEAAIAAAEEAAREAEAAEAAADAAEAFVEAAMKTLQERIAQRMMMRLD